MKPQENQDPVRVLNPDQTWHGPLPGASTFASSDLAEERASLACLLGHQALALLDQVYLSLDSLACNDPRSCTLPFAAAVESAIDRLLDVRAHLAPLYPEIEEG